MQRQRIHQLAGECGFELVGVAEAAPSPDWALYQGWIQSGYAGRMGYLTDHRGQIRSDPSRLVESARSMVCVGKLYSGPEPYSVEYDNSERGWISRYAWGEDYHLVLRRGLEVLAARIAEEAGPHEWKVCVDTAPLLERSYARQAGLGWIGKNTCLINEENGSWFFLGELLTSLALEPDAPPPDRCGTCRRCIDACPTAAIVPAADDGRWTIDSRRCISYLTIELRGPIPEELHAGLGRHVFGCDVCQDVCPWNISRDSRARDATFAPRDPALVAPPLEKLAAMSEQEFREMFRGTPVTRARYEGFQRNVRVAMANRAGVGGRAKV